MVDVASKESAKTSLVQLNHLRKQHVLTCNMYCNVLVVQLWHQYSQDMKAKSVDITHSLENAMNEGVSTSTDPTHFVKAMTEAAKEVYGTHKQNPKKPWITEATTSLIEKQVQHRNRE